MLWQVSHLVIGKRLPLRRASSPKAALATPTEFPALFILVWQVVMELIVQ